ncbi:hypothetical protein B0H21DRAFT_387570 [Amylocystis lapponica]|nr:hypothetical protein B0H21DRAFT_387570 [Amylocystis lapponica]
MPSLFSRSRTTSTPKKFPLDPFVDDFGRITSRGSARGALVVQSPQGTVKKDKKKDAKDKDKSRPKAPSDGADPDAQEFAIPDGAFLSLSLEPPRFETNDPPGEPRQIHDYGYLSYGRHVILGLEQAARLVDVVGNELGTRGLTTPFIFSTLALDVSSAAVKRLIQAFLKTCAKPSAEADRQWREEARFAGPNELGMCLRWGLARVVRIVRGQEVRGLVSYDNYIQWRNDEAALNYPETHFTAFLEPLEPLLRSLLVGLLTLLTRFTAHAASSGHTPPTLSPLFGPLLFGLGPPALAFHHAYMHYLRATTATEHLILAFIRFQNVPRPGSAGAATMGVPTRLKAWIQGYPATLPTISPNTRPQPRRGARTVRVLSVRRNVRMYSPDLVKTAAGWAVRPRRAVGAGSERSLQASKEWERIAPPTFKLAPRYSDGYKKRMDLPASFHPDTGAGSASSSLSAPSLSSSTSTASSATSTLFDEKEHSLVSRPGEDRFRNLSDLKWGEFEVMGFGEGADDKKLQFDLTEGARAARAAKRATLTWQDFSSSGFSRSDAPLNATLQFSPPVSNTINAWPQHSAEIQRKLKKTQKALPAFGWDTEPVLGSEEVIEEAFVDVFCDLVYGGGWMDIERCEDTDRECNWALVEFKSLPIARTTAVSGTADPRTSTTLILFEEFVPLEYRQQLAVSGANRRRLPSLFSNSSKSKQWKPAPTLNGRPYVVGHVPPSPSYREVEFEGLLHANESVTKIISLNRSPSGENGNSNLKTIITNNLNKGMSLTASNVAAPGQTEHTTGPHFLNPVLSRTTSPVALIRTMTRQDGVESPPPGTSPSTKRRFRLPVSPTNRRSTILQEYDAVDFQTRLASFDDDDARSGHGRGRSRDDAWVDILVANSSRRIGGQDAELRGAMLKGGRSDPELASQEVHEVLASVQGQLSTDDEDDDHMEPVDPEHFGVFYSHDTDADTATLESTLERERDSALYGDDEDDSSTAPTNTRRVGYFDLHPERRPSVRIDDDDPRSQFSRQSFDSDAEPQTPIQVAQLKDDAAPSFTSDEEPVRQRTLPHPNNSTAPIPAVNVLPPTPKADLAFPSIPKPPADTSPSATKKPAQTASKTASLIEMYRERERAGTTPTASPAPIPASRLPVRTNASLPSQTSTDKERSTSPAPDARPVSQVSVSTTVTETESDVDSMMILEDVEPNLPIRYVHGAPLHNVLEEEEEEVD